MKKQIFKWIGLDKYVRDIALSLVEDAATKALTEQSEKLVTDHMKELFKMAFSSSKYDGIYSLGTYNISYIRSEVKSLVEGLLKKSVADAHAEFLRNTDYIDVIVKKINDKQLKG